MGKIRAKRIEWRLDSGYIGNECVAEIEEYEHGTYQDPEKRFQLIIFGAEDFSVWYGTREAAQRACKELLDTLVESIAEVSNA